MKTKLDKLLVCKEIPSSDKSVHPTVAAVKKARLRPIMVEWLDHSTISGRWEIGSKRFKDMAKDVVRCITVGFLVYRDAKTIIVTDTLSKDDVNQLTQILRNDIVAVQVLGTGVDKHV